MYCGLLFKETNFKDYYRYQLSVICPQIPIEVNISVLSVLPIFKILAIPPTHVSVVYIVHYGS